MRTLCLLALFIANATGQNLVFSTRVHLACPVQMSAIAQTKDVGFDSVVVKNESKKTIDTVTLNVSLTTESGEEIVEKASFLVMLAPGQSKRVSVGMGRVPELTHKAHSSHWPVVQATLFVASADFTDGTRWSGDEPSINDPIRPLRPPNGEPRPK
jgi:hypothetical protein